MLASLRPDLKRFLTSRVDGRLQVLLDDTTGKPFIASDFNRIKQAYRSPWSNVYIPHSDDIENYYFPPEQLRKIEISFNELLLSYCHLYYENAVGSAYFSEGTESGVFFVVAHVKKEAMDVDNKESDFWESTHSSRVSARLDLDRMHVEISTTSTVLVSFDFGDTNSSSSLNGSMSKTGTRSFISSASEFDEQLIRNLGELIEELENSIRASMEKVCIPRCAELAMASFGTREEDEESLSHISSDSDDNVMLVTDYRSRVSMGSMNPLRRQSAKQAPSFQADLMDAINQRRKTRERMENEQVD
jgi:capping protein beta